MYHYMKTKYIGL